LTWRHGPWRHRADGGPEPVTNNSAKAVPTECPTGIKLDWVPRAAAARRTSTTKDGPTALAPGGNRGVGPRLGHALGGPSSRRGPPGYGKGISLGGTRIQARRPRRAASVTSQAVGSTASQGLRQGSPGSGRGSPLSQKVHEQVTRQRAQPCKGGQPVFPLNENRSQCTQSEGFFAPARPPRKKPPEYIHVEATREHFTQNLLRRLSAARFMVNNRPEATREHPTRHSNDGSQRSNQAAKEGQRGTSSLDQDSIIDGQHRQAAAPSTRYTQLVRPRRLYPKNSLPDRREPARPAASSLKRTGLGRTLPRSNRSRPATGTRAQARVEDYHANIGSHPPTANPNA
jgi:hypothetical protein